MLMPGTGQAGTQYSCEFKLFECVCPAVLAGRLCECYTAGQGSAQEAKLEASLASDFFACGGRGEG